MHYLYKPQTLDDPILSLIKDDPVRPEIPIEFRLSDRSEIYILMEEQKPLSIVCVAYCDSVPSTCEELFSIPINFTIAIFYTIWSYASGSGKELILSVTDHIKKYNKNISRFVTLSPKTEMASRFHLKNGASIFRENSKSFNFEYFL